jgi:hypothetical protein
MLSFQLPHDPLLTLGIGFTLYSLFATPYVRKAEKSGKMEDNLLNAHKEWIPAIIGLIALGLQIGVTLTTDVRLIFGLGLLGYSLAGIIYFFLLPGSPRSIALPVNLSLATSLAIIFWLGVEYVIEPVPLLLYTVILWVIVSLPVTYVNIKAFYSWCTRIISENKLQVVFAFPPIFGVLVGIYLHLTIPLILIPDMILFWNFAIILIPAVLYFIGAHLLEENIAQRLRKPTIALLGPGLLLSFLILTLTGSSLEGYWLIIKISLSLTGTLLLLVLACRSLSLDRYKELLGLR